MRKVIPVVVSVVLATTPAIAAPPAPARPVSTSSTDGQAITIGKTVVTRPFGAVLVDGLTLVSTYRVRGHRVHLVRGNAGGACPARYVFVTEQSGGPVMSNVFGTCSAEARVYPSSGALVVAMPDPLRGGATVRYTFDGRAVTALDYPIAAASAAQPACIPAARIDAAAQGQTVAAIAEGYPADFRGVGRINRAEIEPDEMQSLVTMLACVSAWPTGKYRIPKLATPLFAGRHGPAAFASLAAISQDATSSAYLRSTTRTFAAEMAFRVARREPL